MPEDQSSGESRVFVYGTLRKDAWGRAPSPLTRGWTFEGYGTVAGELYDFGAYPGAVPTEEARSRVRGEVHRLPDAGETLRLLDHYEGCGPEDRPPYEFERELVDVALDDGGTVHAWIYWYRRAPRGRRLSSGDYLERTGPGGVAR
ncbi:MAG TPA: gamma-glutamylcyclotransferase family protein [Longimicrobiales bacterium]|nr:gamma-glutamylcyclotransferase family protein [Longimicrobiales bacterium]